MKELSGEVGDGYRIRVCNRNATAARRGEVDESRRTEAARANDEKTGVGNAFHPLPAEFGKEGLARQALGNGIEAVGSHG